MAEDKDRSDPTSAQSHDVHPQQAEAEDLGAPASGWMPRAMVMDLVRKIESQSERSQNQGEPDADL